MAMDITVEGLKSERLQSAVRGQVRDIRTRAQSCTVRASRELRSAALHVLGGRRTKDPRRVYRVPHTKATYQASSPGEAPAARTGTLRNSWGIIAMGSAALGRYSSGIQTNVPYAPMLEDGTSRMAARPFREKIIRQASPRIGDIFRSAGFR